MQINGASAGDRAGASVANVGDVDADGYEDVLIGAPGADPGGRVDAGSVYLVLGSPSTSDINLSTADPKVLRFDGSEAGAGAGTAVAAGGDVNGDGYMDLLIGAPGDLLPPTGLRKPFVYAIYGGPGLSSMNLANAQSRGFVIKVGEGGVPLTDSLIEPAPSIFGSELGSRRLGDFEVAGDVNGDGRDDILIGHSNEDIGFDLIARPEAGAVWVVFGPPGPSNVDVGAMDSSRGFRINGAKPADRAGQSTDMIGDINGDNLADMAVVAPNAHKSGRLNAGTGYVVFGKADGTPVDLGTLSGKGFAIHGAADDALMNVASIGDVDGDSNPDLLIGGAGAAVVFLQPDVGDVDLAASFAGYRIAAPSGEEYTAAEVAGAGDVDGDDAPDALISFPRANSGAGSTFLVLGQIDSTPIDLAALPGHRGSRLDGSGSSGFSADGIDATPSGPPGMIVGTPGAAPGGVGSGAATIASNGPIASANGRGKDGCERNRPYVAPPGMSNYWAFPYRGDPDAALPRCRRAVGGIVDIPAVGYKGKRAKYNGKPRGCPNETTATCRPAAHRSGNARIKERFLKTAGRVSLVDSFNNPIFDIRQVARPGSSDRNCYEVYRPNGGAYVNKTCETATAKAYLEVVGRACMLTPALEDAHYLVRLLDMKGSTGIRFRELQGFIPRSATTLTTQPNGGQMGRAERAYAGCGTKPRHRMKTKLFALDASDLFVNEDKYVSASLYRRCGEVSDPDPRPEENQDCTPASYTNYQGPILDPSSPGSNVTYTAMTISTNGVSGVGSRVTKTAETHGGGLVRALIPRGPGRTFLQYNSPSLDDSSNPPVKNPGYYAFSYSDPNVVCGRKRVASWVWGDANPNPNRSHWDPRQREQHIYGWVIRKRVETVREC